MQTDDRDDLREDIRKLLAAALAADEGHVAEMEGRDGAMYPKDRLGIEVVHLDGVAVLALHGEIDLVSAPLLHDSIQEFSELGVPVVLDMAEVTFMDSSGLRSLLGASGVTSGLPSSVQIRNASGPVRRVLSLTGLEEVFSLES